MGEILNTHQPLQTISLTVHTDSEGLVSIRMLHPHGLRTVLLLDSDETSNLIDTLIEAMGIIEPPAPKPRIAVSLVRSKA